MSLGELLIDLWRKTLVEGATEIEMGDLKCRLSRTRSQGLRIVTFTYQGWSMEGIEQNPQTSSRWAKLAQEGKRIMQFRCDGRYCANVCEGKLTRYPAWKAHGLPE